MTILTRVDNSLAVIYFVARHYCLIAKAVASGFPELLLFSKVCKLIHMEVVLGHA